MVSLLHKDVSSDWIHCNLQTPNTQRKTDDEGSLRASTRYHSPTNRSTDSVSNKSEDGRSVLDGCDAGLQHVRWKQLACGCDLGSKSCTHPGQFQTFDPDVAWGAWHQLRAVWNHE